MEISDQPHVSAALLPKNEFFYLLQSRFGCIFSLPTLENRIFQPIAWFMADESF
jgi:hypothetical protein